MLSVFKTIIFQIYKIANWELLNWIRIFKTIRHWSVFFWYLIYWYGIGRFFLVSHLLINVLNIVGLIIWMLKTIPPHQYLVIIPLWVLHTNVELTMTLVPCRVGITAAVTTKDTGISTNITTGTKRLLVLP